MKNTRKPFYEELKRRLLNYGEEPDNDLWKGIVPHIGSVSREPNWIVWITRLSIIIIALSTGVFMIFREDAVTTQAVITKNQMIMPGSPAIDTLEVSGTSDSRLQSSSSKLFKHPIVISDHDAVDSKTPPVPLTLLRADLQWKKAIASRPVNTDTRSRHDETAAAVSTDTPTQNAISPKPDKQAKHPAEQQESSASKKTNQKKKPFSLYFTAMPTFGYQRIESNSTDNLFIESIKRIPAFSADRLGVRLEAGAEVPLSKRWTIFGGLLYFQRQQTIEYIERQTENLMNGSGPDTGDPGRSLDAIPQYRYVGKSVEYELKNAGLQLGFNYHLWVNREDPVGIAAIVSSKGVNIPRKKFVHVLGSGIEFHKALNRPDALMQAEQFTDPSSFIFFNLYYRMQYPDAGRLRAVLQPTFNYSLYINKNFNAPFYVKPYGLGLNFGATYNLR